MKKYLIFLLFAFLVYGGSLHYGFSQDDWYFLLISKANSLKDILLFFSPFHQQGFPFYRPLGTQLYFYLATLLAGLAGAPLIMHTFMLFLLGTSGYLLSLIARVRRFNNFQSTLAGLLYVGSSVHFLSLYYIAATQQLLASTLLLFAIYLFHRARHFAASFVFVFALLSKESALFLPVYLFLLSDWKVLSWQSLKKNLLSLRPYFFITLVYLTLRLISTSEIQSEYHLVFGARMIGAGKIYLSFLFGYYEKIQDYVLPVGIKQYLIDTYPFGYLTILGSLVSIIAITATTCIALAKRALSRESLQYLLAVAFGVAPWLLLPDHIFPHYLDLPMAFFALLLVSLTKKRIILTLIAISLLLANYGGIKSSEILHWTVLRSRLNARIVPDLLTRGLCESSSVVLVGNEALARELSYSLSLSNAPRVLCNNPNLRLYYKGEAVDNAVELSLDGL